MDTIIFVITIVYARFCFFFHLNYMTWRIYPMYPRIFADYFMHYYLGLNTSRFLKKGISSCSYSDLQVECEPELTHFVHPSFYKTWTSSQMVRRYGSMRGTAAPMDEWKLCKPLFHYVSDWILLCSRLMWAWISSRVLNFNLHTRQISRLTLNRFLR